MSTGATRRDFVALLLGAPVAAGLAGVGAGLGCSRRPALPDGELIETGRRRGHAAVRDAGPSAGPPAGPDQTRRCEVVIIGGGVAGLAAAWALRRAGVRDLLVLELDDVIGGTARAHPGPVTPAPWGAHYIVAPQREQHDLVALLGELGAIEGWTSDGTAIVDEALRCREPEERLYYRGRWYPGLYQGAGASADDVAQLRAFEAEVDRWAGWRDGAGRRAFTSPVSACSADAEVAALDQLSFAAWLDGRGLTSPRLRWLADYACRDDYALTAAGTSAWAGLFYFASRRPAPGAEAQAVVTWPDGNAPLVRQLAAGVEVVTGAAVTTLEADADGVVARGVGTAGPFAVAARHAVIATPAFVARRLVPALAARALPPPDTGAWAVANLTLRARPRPRGGEAPPAWDNVLYDSPSLGYVSATHQAGADHGPTVWTWYYPFTEGVSADHRRQLESATRADWAEVVLADLERPHPDLRDLVSRVDVAFWGHGMPRPGVGRIFDPTRRQRAEPIGRLHFAHTDLSGLALFEEAFDHGLRAAREIIAARVA